MTHIIPDYYKNFRCIADKCKHNCCIGWEIDIDDETYNKYININTEFGEKLKNNIKSEPDRNYFILFENDRCPFLNKNNLCEIIINCGENHLCEICTEHPRFHNYYVDRTESGIGLCCEEASRIIITNKEKVNILNNDIDNYYVNYRNKLFDIIQNRDINIKQRIESLLKQSEYKITNHSLSYWIKIYLSLERLDESWTEILNKAIKIEISIFDNVLMDTYSVAAEQLIVYFLYRHTPKAELELLQDEWILFSVLSCCIIFNICEYNGITDLDGICDIARMYSSEIEYSDENTDMIFDKLI